MALPSFPVLYSTPRADAVADFVSTHYDLHGPIRCKLLSRGWNDIFEIEARGEVRQMAREIGHVDLGAPRDLGRE